MTFIKLLLVFIAHCSYLTIMADEHVDEHSYNYDSGGACKEIYDPYEKFNRKVFALNLVLDRFILRPVAIGYKKFTNDYSKARINSFLDNINTPLTAVNYGLQLNYDKTMSSVWRFLINTTFGVGGLFDVASKVGLSPDRQTFGNTLARYGVEPGPYLVIPLLGGTSMRDATDSLFTNYILNPITWYTHEDFILITFVVDKINDRYLVLPFTDYVMENSPDPYVAMRYAQHQNREASVKYPANFKCRARPMSVANIDGSETERGASKSADK